MGVYRTTGGNPELLSDIIRPLWFGDPEVYYQGSPINLNQLGLVRMAWHAEQFFVAVPDRLERLQRPAAGLRHRAQLVDDLRHRRVGAGAVPARRSQRAAPRLLDRPAARRAPHLRLANRSRPADHLALALGLV
jgi:hypothetical protein